MALFSVVIDRLSFFLTKNLFGFFWRLELAYRGVTFDFFKTMSIVGRPIINMAYKSEIIIGKNVILMSSSRFCLSSSLYAPCKLKTIFKCAKIEICDNVSMNGTSVVCRSTKIYIGARTMVGPNVAIMDSPFHPMKPIDLRNYYPGNELDNSVFIGEDVWIGAQVIILPGAKIGRGSVIGAGSIVRGEIPEKCLAVGTPARVIKYIE